MMVRVAAHVAITCLAATLCAGSAASYSRSYMCFFVVGSAELTDRCRQVVEEAAANWHRLHQGRQADLSRFPTLPRLPAYTARLQVQGNAQDVEKPEASDGLSALRAVAVANELRRLLVPAEFITPVGLGSERPIVQDAPLDPQNRYVMIIFR